MSLSLFHRRLGPKNPRQIDIKTKIKQANNARTKNNRANMFQQSREVSQEDFNANYPTPFRKLTQNDSGEKIILTTNALFTDGQDTKMLQDITSSKSSKERQKTIRTRDRCSHFVFNTLTHVKKVFVSNDNDFVDLVVDLDDPSTAAAIQGAVSVCNDVRNREVFIYLDSHACDKLKKHVYIKVRIPREDQQIGRDITTLIESVSDMIHIRNIMDDSHQCTFWTKDSPEIWWSVAVEVTYPNMEVMTHIRKRLHDFNTTQFKPVYSTEKISITEPKHGDECISIDFVIKYSVVEGRNQTVRDKINTITNGAMTAKLSYYDY